MDTTKLKSGYIFVVKIENYFVAGLIARVSKNIALLYFYNKRFKKEPAKNDFYISDYKVCYISRASTLGLKNGAWKILFPLDEFDKSKWEIPVFIRKDVLDKSLRKIYYDENLKEVNDQYVKKGENVKGLPEDGLAGYVYVENVLEKIFLK